MTAHTEDGFYIKASTAIEALAQFEQGSEAERTLTSKLEELGYRHVARFDDGYRAWHSRAEIEAAGGAACFVPDCDNPVPYAEILPVFEPACAAHRSRDDVAAAAQDTAAERREKNAEPGVFVEYVRSARSCWVCSGRGHMPGYVERECTSCGGTGRGEPPHPEILARLARVEMRVGVIEEGHERVIDDLATLARRWESPPDDLAAEPARPDPNPEGREDPGERQPEAFSVPRGWVPFLVSAGPDVRHFVYGPPVAMRDLAEQVAATGTETAARLARLDEMGADYAAADDAIFQAIQGAGLPGMGRTLLENAQTLVAKLESTRDRAADYQRQLEAVDAAVPKERSDGGPILGRVDAIRGLVEELGRMRDEFKAMTDLHDAKHRDWQAAEAKLAELAQERDKLDGEIARLTNALDAAGAESTPGHHIVLSEVDSMDPGSRWWWRCSCGHDSIGRTEDDKADPELIVKWQFLVHARGARATAAGDTEGGARHVRPENNSGHCDTATENAQAPGEEETVAILRNRVAHARRAAEEATKERARLEERLLAAGLTLGQVREIVGRLPSDGPDALLDRLRVVAKVAEVGLDYRDALVAFHDAFVEWEGALSKKEAGRRLPALIDAAIGARRLLWTGLAGEPQGASAKGSLVERAVAAQKFGLTVTAMGARS